MISLYESILGDIDINIAASDDAAVILSANAEGSILRNFLGIHKDYEVAEPFDIDGKTLKIFGPNCKLKYLSTYSTLISWDTDNNPNKSVDSILGIKLDRIETKGSLIITGNNISNVSKRYAPELQASNIKFIYPKNTVVKDLNLTVATHKMANIVPSILFTGDSTITLQNVDMFVDKHILSRINFTKLPIFKNVSSNMDKLCIEVPRNADPVIKEDDVFEDPRYNDLFEFGYSLKYELEGKISTVKVKDMKSLKTMVTTSSFYKRRYEEFPYRLKPNVRLNDILDVSKWPNLEQIIIQSKKMYISICKKKHI